MAADGELNPEDANTIEQVIGTGAPEEGIGTFRYLFAERHWEWSPEVARMHGYRPGEVEPTTELLLSHKHPEDRDRVAALITSVEDGAPFSSSHRIVDTTGRIHHVIVVSDQLLDESGQQIGTAGYYIDLTTTVAEQQRRTLDETLPELFAAGAEIEQARGALMVVYGISAEQALRLLLWRSQETRVPLRSLCARLTAEIAELTRTATDVRGRFDHLLLTVHQGIADSNGDSN
ncbi:PAS and ANTAR domain-containing protein [Nocardia transvalensis]|uniref:PAS and ANTAR domain-containing protein n=1 Tax=Nocardia transvalensis TaxID=37333 RepID=UPI00189481B2|nr:PAS and ANTAR domain-containing protein [Nocardia transvalensis]MBF6329641.1 PAS domain-containing protein [Nocardia transvalensis]